MTFKEKLQGINACSPAIEWLGDRTEEQCLAECNRGDWLLWWFFKEKNNEGYPDIKTITKVKVECARLVVHLMQDERSKIALNVAWAWANNEATDQELATAATAAYAADAADADAAAATAAYTAAYATAAYTADAATAAAAGLANVAAYARVKVLKECADICRNYFYLPKNS